MRLLRDDTDLGIGAPVQSGDMMRHHGGACAHLRKMTDGRAQRAQRYRVRRAEEGSAAKRRRARPRRPSVGTKDGSRRRGLPAGGDVDDRF